MVHIKKLLKKNLLTLSFFSIHIFFAIFLGRFYVLAPDEKSYLNTFNNIFTLTSNSSDQALPGWTSAPRFFLWIVYLPAKILNLIGIPDFLSIRILSIILATISLYYILNLLERINQKKKISQGVIFATFSIPSVFIWTSLGLRESFLIFELTIFFVGMNILFKERSKKGPIFLFLASYSLICTKSYLWACLMIAVILGTAIIYFWGQMHKQAGKLLVIGFILPLVTFSTTASPTLLNFVYQSSISDTGSRSGDSINEVFTHSLGESLNTKKNLDNEPVTLNGNYTLIAINSFLAKNPNALLSKTLQAFSLDTKVKEELDEALKQNLIEDKQGNKNDVSLQRSHILEVGELSRPISIIWPAFMFLFGPFPFIDNSGFTIGLSAFESPLWWILYFLIIAQFFRFRKTKFWRDPSILIAFIFFIGFVLASALVEVNQGTSFRHRSILIVPLLFLYARLTQRATEQKALE
jgi:hypothetical protein